MQGDCKFLFVSSYFISFAVSTYVSEHSIHQSIQYKVMAITLRNDEC